MLAALSRLDPSRRRLLLALLLQVGVTGIFFAMASRDRWVSHTPFNHFALLAEAWLKGRLDLGGPPPAYTQNNDFAVFGGRWYVTFPPFPALLLVPLTWLAGSAERVRDGQFFLWLSGLGPALLFLALEQLRASGRSERSELENLLLASLLAFGSVYFFSALQGTVWFAAHVVGVALAALYLLCALDAERPLLAGLAIGCGFLTRTPLLFAVPLFAVEALRVSLRPAAPGEPRSSWADRLDVRRLVRLGALFALPIVGCVALALWHNARRFGDPGEFGYQYLTVAWQGRMKKWGLFHYHYLARNLGVVLTSLPWLESHGPAPFRINAHGLALWVTTPLYLWLLWPRRVGWLGWGLGATALAVALPGLFYQNTGWVQFGYRFSNDFAVFLFALLAVGGRRFGVAFHVLAAWSVAVNTFGALSFDRQAYARYYFEDRSQTQLYQPD